MTPINCFGGFGQQGYGYNVQLLHGEISAILGLDIPKTAILIGMGNMGTSHAKSFVNGKIRGMRITAVADTCEDKLLWSKENLPELPA